MPMDPESCYLHSVLVFFYNREKGLIPSMSSMQVT